ncbi:unnamed protein product [Kuraishia capsulata CBS 1993]|uniref:Prefoldin subunit 5 n=1 Tax=Kuraishia capsulata CBS 1993 TaxID=1382522 RepID=W6MTG5_9ASCO|nr:uncharacterized protein KUCA_T00006004001 [Kuraishia capsulata CBS 1993]CDK30009.1 unnamed protein product [Kuraishia capsulata CBS 1993]
MSQGKRVDLTTLPPEQIVEFNRQVRSEISHLENSMRALYTAKAKFGECISSVDKVVDSKGQQMLVPLTSSLYVPGKVKEDKKFLVDVGTGYFVEKDAKDAKSFFSARIQKLESDAQELNKLLVEKDQLSRRINDILRQKIMDQENANVAS